MARLEAGQSMSPFALLHLSIELQLFSPLFECLVQAVDSVLGEDTSQGILGEESGYVLGKEVGSELLEAVRTLDDSEEFFTTYLELVKDLLPNSFVDLDFDHFANGVWEILESDELQSSEVNGYDTIYVLRQNLIGVTQSSPTIALVPFYFVMGMPFWPPAAGNKIGSLVRAKLVGDVPLSLDKVRLLLAQDGILCSADFLRFSLLNDKEVLLIHGKTEQVDLCEEVFLSFDLIAQATPPLRYASFKKAFGWERSSNEIEIDEVAVKELFRRRGETRYLEQVDPTELAVKLYLTACIPVSNKQGLPTIVHAEIVKVLNDTGKALRLSDLQRITGLLELDLEPEKLPPGRILAYAPSPRFLNKYMAFYVLEEWVETESEKRGRIPKDRVITPREEKHFDLPMELIGSTVKKDATSELYGVIDVERIALHLARCLPKRPTENFYLKLIQEGIEDYLSDSYDELGKGLFIERSRGFKKPYGISMSRWRREVALKLLNNKGSLSGVIEKLDTEHRDVFIKLL